MNNVIGICDRNTMYMKKLAESFMQKSDIPLQIMTFSDYGQLIQYLKEGTLDILISDGELSADIMNQWSVDTGMEEENRKAVIRQHIGYELKLSDENIGIENTGEFSFRIGRYQSSSEIFCLIKQLITGQAQRCGIPAAYNMGKRNSERLSSSDIVKGGFGKGNPIDYEKGERCIIAVYSPVGRCGKTSLAVLLSELLQRKGESLMICMDHYSSLFSAEEFNLSELIYCMSRESNLRLGESRIHDFSEYEDYTKKWEELTYIPAPRAVEDLNQISAVQLCSLLDMLKYGSKYHYIVLDLSKGMENLQNVLEKCDYIFMPVLHDCVSRCKVEEFDRFMMKMMGHGAWNALSVKIHRVQLPSAIETEGIENYYRELIWSDLANDAGEILNQYGI